MTDGDLADRVEDIVHEQTQVNGDGSVDLTAAEVYRIERAGRVDFGGDELAPAETAPHGRAWRNEDDDYGWWHLDPGTYLVEHNESLTGDGRAVLETRGAVLERGAFHPTLRVRDLPRVPLSVGDGGIRLKENARISTLSPL